MLITELIRRGAVAHAEQVAIRCADQALTFKEADALSNRLAGALIATGMAPIGASDVQLPANHSRRFRLREGPVDPRAA
jgi:non-ribosomal peptide synthetase component E (peptide arylation enzyme)